MPTLPINHIIFADDIANGCGQSGFAASPNGSAGMDYFAVVGSIAYNAAQGSYNCTSGINLFEPIASDSAPGTHIFFAGNFAFDNIEPSSCAGSTPTDGQGLFFDTTELYSQQVVIGNNIAIYRRKRHQGLRKFDWFANAQVYIRHNTTYGNELGRVNRAESAELPLQSNLSTTAFANFRRLSQRLDAWACLRCLFSASSLLTRPIKSIATTVSVAQATTIPAKESDFLWTT